MIRLYNIVEHLIAFVGMRDLFLKVSVVHVRSGAECPSPLADVESRSKALDQYYEVS